MPGGKIKQDVVVVDLTAKATVTLWESNIGVLKLKQNPTNLIDSKTRDITDKETTLLHNNSFWTTFLNTLAH